MEISLDREDKNKFRKNVNTEYFPKEEVKKNIQNGGMKQIFGNYRKMEIKEACSKIINRVEELKH